MAPNIHMNDRLTDVLEKQTQILEQLAVSKNGENGDVQTKTPAGFSTYTPLHGPGGIWTGPGLERDVITAHVRPQGIAPALRLLPTVNTNPQFGILTGFTAGDVDSEYWVTEHCADVPAGYMKSCTLTAQFGALRVDSQTIDMDDVMLKLHRGDFTDLILHGELLGLTGLNPSDTSQGDVLNLVTASEMVQMGVQTERLLSRALWQGAVANNQFPGLAAQVATGQVDVNTGAACPAADSDVKDFALDEVGGAGRDIVEYLSMLEFYLQYNARTMGHDPVDWVVVMRPELWFELSAIWPCAYNTNRCANSVIGTASRVVIDGRENVAERDRMRTGNTIDINGNTYPVIVDTGIFEHNNINNANLDPMQFASSIFMIPLTIRGGLPVTYRQYLDYRMAARDVSFARGNLNVWWTDSGVFAWSIEQTKWCYKFSLKSQQRVILQAPHLAGRIDNVMYTPLQHLREPHPDQPYFADGGVSLRATDATRYAVWL
jgi:hypothetical protein